MPKQPDHVPFCAKSVVVLAVCAGCVWLVAGCSSSGSKDSVVAGSGEVTGDYEDGMAGAGSAPSNERNESGGANGEVCGPVSDWRELPTEGVVPPVKLGSAGVPRQVIIDSKLIVINYYGDQYAPNGERGIDLYDPEQNQWRAVPKAEQVPAEIEFNPQPMGLWNGTLLVRGGDANGDVNWATFDPLNETWEPFDASSAPEYLYVPPILWIPDGTGDYVLASSMYQSTESFVREYNLAMVDTRVFAWGGRTKVCMDAPNCTPVALLNDNPAQPYFDQDLHGDGEVLDAATDTRVPIPLQDAPSPRYSALVQVMGSKVLVFGGLDNPYWGRGSGPESDHLLTDGALYDLERERWLPFTPPDGMPPPFVSNADSGQETARFSFQWTGRYALATVRILGAGSQEFWHYLYDPETDSWRSLDIDAASSVLVTRAGNLLQLDPDYAGATLIDVDDLSTRRIELDPPDMLQDNELTGPAITAWDGCSYFVWGFGRVESSTMPNVCTNVPPGMGCDLPGPQTRILERFGGARFTIEE